MARSFGSSASAEVSKGSQDGSGVLPKIFRRQTQKIALVSIRSEVSTEYDVPLWRHLSYEAEIESTRLGYGTLECPDPACPLETHPDEKEDYRKTICAAGISHCGNTI